MALKPVDAFMADIRGRASRWSIEHDAFDEEMREFDEKLNRPLRALRVPRLLKPRKPSVH